MFEGPQHLECPFRLAEVETGDVLFRCERKEIAAAIVRDERPVFGRNGPVMIGGRDDKDDVDVLVTPDDIWVYDRERRIETPRSYKPFRALRSRAFCEPNS